MKAKFYFTVPKPGVAAYPQPPPVGGWWYAAYAGAHYGDDTKKVTGTVKVFKIYENNSFNF